MTALLRLATVVVVPIALLIAFSQIVGAAHRPGDGFTAGIITSLGLTLQYVVFGQRRARAALRVRAFERVLMVGLIVAFTAAAFPIVLGLPFLAPESFTVRVPVLGTIALTRGLVLDLGIYLVVVGGAMGIVDSIGQARQP